MIAYLEKYDTTVQLPDDVSQSDAADINNNFHSYVGASPEEPQAATPTQEPQKPTNQTSPPSPQPQAKWQPNFYESYIKPSLDQVLGPAKAIATLPEKPEAQAFTGGVAEEGTFGLAKPLVNAFLAQQMKEHPAYAEAGELTGGIGSLMVGGAAARALGAGTLAARAGAASVEAGFAAGERFIPRAIMSGATFGTRAFIAETVKAFEEGGANLEQFGKDVLKDTAFGSIFGTIGGLSNATASVSSAGALGFLSSKMSGADNREASLNAAIWAAFETVGSVGRSEELRMEALRNLKGSIGEYVGARNPNLDPKDAHRAAGAFVDNAIRKAGFENAEDIAKSGPENLLEGIEKVNQIIRTAHVPAEPEAGRPALPKLPAPVTPEGEATPQAPAPQPQTPLEKAIETVKGIMGIKPETPEPKSITVTGDTYEEKIKSLKDQGHDISKMPESAFPEDMKDVYHYEQGRLGKAEVSKAVSDISERLNAFGVKPEETKAIFDKYGLGETNSLGQPVPFYHGSGTGGISRIDPNITSHEGLFGQGFYITDNPDVAKGYAKSRGSETGQSHLYRTILNKGNTLDLESPLKDEFRDALLAQASAIDRRMGYVKRSDYSPGDDTKSIETSLEQQIRTGEVKTNQDLFRQFRERIKDASVNEMIPTSEWVEDFQELNDKLRGKGFDALTYQGGRRLGKGKYPPHKVMVVINPEMVASLSEVNPSEATFVPNLINAPIDDQYKTAYRTIATQRGIEPSEKFDARTMEDAKTAVDLINDHFNPQSQMVFDFAKQHSEMSDHDVAQMAYDRGMIEQPNNDLLKMELQKAKQEKIIASQVSAMRAGEAGPQGPQEQKPTGQALPGQPETSPLSEEDQRIAFPGPRDPSLKSITGDPAYVNMRQKAAEIVHRYARERGIQPSPELAQSLFQELHDALGDVRSAKPEDRVRVAKEIMAKYPKLEDDFVTLKDQLYSDVTEPYFEKYIKGQKYGDSEPKINAMMAPGAAVLPKRPEAIIPAVAAHMQESKSELENLLVPSKAAPLAAQITRETLGKMARSYDMAEAALSDARTYFDKQPKEKNLEFIDRLERGFGQPDKNEEAIAGTLRKLLDDKRSEVQALGKGKLESFIDNYFPHIWDQGEKQVSQVVMKAAKRPFEGSKGFLKKRSIEFTKDGIEMGLTPVSYNPVDLALLKIREMDKYLAAHRTIKEYKANGLAKYVKIGGDVPEGWTKIDDRISTVFKSPMIPVKEAYDAKIMGALTDVAKSLGIDLERSVRKPREGHGMGDGLWGLSVGSASGEAKPGKIWTRFAGPESAMAHELGHQLDNMFDLQSQFLGNPTLNHELTQLANERMPEGKASASFKKYIQTPPEKMAVMLESYIHAPDLLKEKAPQTYEKLENFLNSKPKLKPLTQVEPSLVMAINKSEVSAGGAVIAGHIYAQPDAARIINNYLSPGLQKSAIYQAYRYAGNMINQFQLGFSAFHLGFTSLDSVVSKFALALNQLADGHPINAVANAIRSPFAPIENIIRGDELLKAWRGEGKNASDDVLAQAMASAGGRARMDQFYATSAYEQMKHHFEAGNLLRGILHTPLAIADISSKPLLEFIVPRQKLGVFSDIMKMEMQNHPDMTHQEMRAVAQRAWDSVDNRMGQLVYDNLFWNRTFKDLLMGSVRSVGWNLGTIRELAGGGADYAEALANAVRGKKSEFTYRMAYFTALPIVVGIMGAVIQYLRTGKGPQEMKDYFYPKTGGIDANGDAHRIALPSYMKDIYHYSQAPIQTVANKLNPLIAMVEQMLANKDYFGTKIRNEDDPLTKQVASEVAYMLKQIQPFSIRNMQKNLETQNKSLFDTLGPWIGVTPAPYDIDQTKAEKLAHQIAMSHQQIGGRTQEQAERSKLLSDLTREYRRNDPKATDDVFKAYQSGLISHRQMQEVIVHARMTPLQRMVRGMSLDEAERVYVKATDEEKGQIESMVERKRATKEREFVAQ